MDISLYEDHARLEQDHWWFVARRAILEEVLRSHLPDVPDRQVLDVGCGTGGMLPMLNRFGHVVGLEGEPLAVEHCRSTFGGFDVQLGNIPSDVPSHHSFDLVTAFDVIEHIEDDHGALASLRSALRPGGTLIVTVPALAWLWSDHDVVNGHQRRYTRRSLAGALGGAGFRVTHLSYFNTVLLPAVAVSRVAQRLPSRAVRPRSDFTMPSTRRNALLTRVMSSEARAVSRRGLPLGVSLVAVATPGRPVQLSDDRDAKV